MDKTPYISPGEKLLEVIRGSSDEPVRASRPAARPLFRGMRERFVAPRLRWGKTTREVSVGVEVGERVIRMVKLTRLGVKPVSVEISCAPVPAPGPDAPELSLTLRLALKDFLGRAEALVWSMVPAESADIFFLNVPKTGRKQLSSAVYWTAKKEGDFNEADVVFDYEVQGEVTEKGAQRLLVTAYTASRAEHDRLRALFMQAGYPLVGLTLPSAACRNLFAAGWTPPSESPQVCLHLGEESSRVEIISGGQLRHVRVLKGGLSGMAQTLAEASRQSALLAAKKREASRDTGAKSPFFSSDIPVVLESMAAPEPTPEPQADPGLELDQARQLIDSLTRDGEAPAPDQEGPSPETVAALLEPAWERLARQVEMTLKHFSITLGNEQPSRLYVCGPHGANGRLRRYLREILGLECLALDPLGRENMARVGVSTPDNEPGERLEYALALGLTGCRRDAFNLLHTYKEKEEQARVAGLNRMVVAGWLALAGLCLGVYGWQNVQAHGKRMALAGLQAELDSFRPRVDKNLLTSTQARVLAVVENLRRYCGRTFAQAMLHDVCELTPVNVRLYSISLDLGSPSEQPAPPRSEPTPPVKPRPPGMERPGLNTLMLEGFVKGDSQLLESILSAYLVRLRSSPLLADVSVSKRALEVSPEGEDMLRFTLACAVRR